MRTQYYQYIICHIIYIYIHTYCIYIILYSIYPCICQSVASALNEEESAHAKCANLWPRSYTQLAAELNLGNASAHSLYFIRISRPWLGRDDCFQQKVGRLPQNARCRKEKRSSEGLQAQMADINTKRMSPHQINPILPKRSQKHSAARLRRLQISTLAGSNSASLWVVRMEKSNMKRYEKYSMKRTRGCLCAVVVGTIFNFSDLAGKWGRNWWCNLNCHDSAGFHSNLGSFETGAIFESPSSWSSSHCFLASSGIQVI